MRNFLSLNQLSRCFNIDLSIMESELITYSRVPRVMLNGDYYFNLDIVMDYFRSPQVNNVQSLYKIEKPKKNKKNKRAKSINYDKAHGLVNSAILSKRLIRPLICEKCGSTSKKSLHAHHDDYLKPLDVRFLCAKCHGGWHAQNGSGANR